MKCPNCGAEIANDSVFCENCGAKVAKKSHKALWGCIGIVLCIAVVGCVFLTKSGSSQDDYVLDRPTYDTEHNPIVNRLSDREISQDRTPAAIAYNFVLAISHEDWDKMVSPGLSTARNTAALACAPECGCTLAYSAPKIWQMRSIASCSTLSTTWQPP